MPLPAWVGNVHEQKQKPRMGNQLAAELDHVLTCTEGLWDELRNQRIFITGGTGFFGCWLMESFCVGQRSDPCRRRRYPDRPDAGAFARKAPHLAHHSAIHFHQGDVRSFDFPAGEFSHVIHAATDGDVKIMAEEPLVVFDINVHGTRRALKLPIGAAHRGFCSQVQEAVYGRQPPRDFSDC